MDLINDSVVLRLCRLVDAVILILADHRAIGRDHDDIELVDVPKLLRLSLCRTGHTGELVIHAEVILQRDRRLGLRGLLHLYVLLRLDRLMKSVGVAATIHDTTGLLVDDHHLIVDHNILIVSIEEGVSL